MVLKSINPMFTKIDNGDNIILNFANNMKYNIRCKDNKKYENEEVENLLYEKANVAKIRRVGFENIHREYHSANLKKWANYREEKVEMVRNYIALLKRKRRAKVFIIHMWYLRIFYRIHENIAAVKNLLREKFARLVVAISDAVVDHPIRSAIFQKTEEML